MTMDFDIEEILVDEIDNHIDDIIDVRTEAYREWNGEKTSKQKRDEAISWIEKMRDRSNTRIYVAKIDDSIVGYVWGYEKAENEFYISHIGVLPEFQRRGIGRSLIQKCETLCVDRRYERLSIQDLYQAVAPAGSVFPAGVFFIDPRPGMRHRAADRAGGGTCR